MKLIEKNSKLLTQNNSTMPSQQKEIWCQLYTKEGYLENECPTLWKCDQEYYQHYQILGIHNTNDFPVIDVRNYGIDGKMSYRTCES